MTLCKDIMGGGTSAGAARGIVGSTGTVAAAGSAQGSAAAIGFATGVITAADGTKGVILPTMIPGEEITIFNNANANLLVYPATGAAISVSGTGLGSANAALTVAAYKTAHFIAYSSTQIISHVS